MTLLEKFNRLLDLVGDPCLCFSEMEEVGTLRDEITSALGELEPEVIDFDAVKAGRLDKPTSITLTAQMEWARSRLPDMFRMSRPSPRSSALFPGVKIPGGNG